MGQNQTYANPILEDWQRHPTDENVFVNFKTGEQVQQYAAILKKSQEPILKKRMQQHHNFITKILYYEPAQKNKIIKEEAKYFVYTQKLYPLCHQLWVPVNSALSILKGYRRLSSNYGMMRVHAGMVKVNSNKEIQVWISENPAKSNQLYRASDQEQMLADIVKIIMQFDSQTGGLLMKCFTLNQAINSILHNMTQNKSALHFSSRTHKKQDKSKNYQKETTLGSNKNNFRSTKQTQDDSLKNFNDSGMKKVSKNDSFMESKQKQISVNYLQGVNIQKSPTYINASKMSESPQKIQTPILFKKDSNDSQASYLSYSHQNYAQKASSIQFNNTQPQLGKLTGSNRAYVPIEHRHQNATDSPYNYNKMNTQMTPNYERSFKEKSKRKDILLMPYQPGRQSNLDKNYLEKIQNSQEGSQQNQKTDKSSLYVNERSQITTSREFNSGESQPFLVNRSQTNSQHFNLMSFDATRTKTQEFYTANQLHGVSPRVKTNIISTNAQGPKQKVVQSGFNQIKKMSEEIPLHTHLLNKKSEEEINDSINQKLNAHTQPLQQQTKKQTKLKQAERIKQQMGSLGIKPMANDKSVRDLLIKQRVEQKNKKHEQLKSAITKLLSQ